MEKLFQICFITNRSLVKERPLIEVVKDALSAGVDAVLLREPDLKPKMLYYIAKEFRKITKEFNARLLVKDRVDLAMLVEADGVHLSADGLPPEDVRKIWNGLIGYSAHSVEEIKVVEEYVDYVFLSPVFYTRSKPMAKPLGVEYLKKAIIETITRVYPLGGINSMTVNELKDLDIPGVAVMSAFFRERDVKSFVEVLKSSLEVTK